MGIFRVQIRFPLIWGTLGMGAFSLAYLAYTYLVEGDNKESKLKKSHPKGQGPLTKPNVKLPGVFNLDLKNKGTGWYRYLDRTEFWKLPPDELWNRVLFFPELFPEKEGSQTRQLLWYMGQAEKTLKVAIYTYTCRLFDKVLIDLVQTKKVKVQVITNTRVRYQLRRRGVQIREKPKLLPSPHGHGLFLDHMHNKFIIIDDKAVLTGSLNWTMAALAEQRNNVLVTNNPDIVKPFVEEFTKIWEISDPNLYRKNKEGQGTGNRAC